MSCWKTHYQDQDQPAQKRKCKGGGGIDRSNRHCCSITYTFRYSIYFLVLLVNILWPRITQHFLRGVSRLQVYTRTRFFFYLFFFCLWPQIPAATLYLSRVILPLSSSRRKKNAPLHTHNSFRWLFFFFLFCLRCCAFHPIFGFLSPFHPSAARLEMSSLLDVNSCQRRLHDVDWILFFGMGILIVFFSLCTSRETAQPRTNRRKYFPCNGERRTSLK